MQLFFSESPLTIKLDALPSNIFSVFSAYYITICHPTCCSANYSTFSHRNLMSAGLANAYTDSQKQYPASHVATTPLLLSQNGLRSNLRVLKISWGSIFQDTPPHPLPSGCILCKPCTQAIHTAWLQSYILWMRPISWSPQCS